MVMWLMVGLPAIYLGIGASIAALAMPDYPMTPRLFFEIMWRWPSIFWLRD